MAKKYLITGCSGGGKSSLITALKERGFNTVAEPGLRVIEEERIIAGNAFPWIDLAAFALKAISLSLSDLETADRLEGPLFFDRGLIDAATALEFAGGSTAAAVLGNSRQYERTVFFAPPWPEIFESNIDRRHDLISAIEECRRLEKTLHQFSYEIVVLPKVPLEDRVTFVIERTGCLPL